MFGLTVHPPANVGDVGKDCFLGTFSGDLGGHDGVSPFLAGELGVVRVKQGEEAAKQLRAQGISSI